MKCDICRDRPAVIFVQQVSKDGSVELHLCEPCAKERGFSTSENKIDISLGGLFSGFLEKENTSAGKEITCPLCGTSFHEIKKKGKVGCASCYQQFRSDIIALLRSEGVEFSYTGPLPDKLDAFSMQKTDPENLKKELHDAIEREDYELAAYYRDRLKMLGRNL